MGVGGRKEGKQETDRGNTAAVPTEKRLRRMSVIILGGVFL